VRAREFTINVPITIKINGDGDPEIDMPGNEVPNEDPELQQNPVMVSPLQQQLELLKVDHGKESPIMDKITQSDGTGIEKPAPEIGTATPDDTVINNKHTNLLNVVTRLPAR
jgi:hypothetical protein